MNFIEIPLDRPKGSHWKKIYGVGLNDADYKVYGVIDGKRVRCPYYNVWVSMLSRCYSDKYHARQPTYIGCKVDSEWLIFSAFKSWMMNQDWKGKQLDKDILEEGNKLYSPERCVFVSRYINTMIQDQSSKKGGFPLGVEKLSYGRFRASIYTHGKTKHLGVMDSIQDAHKAYIKAKVHDLFELSNAQVDLRIRDGILNRALTLNRSIHFG